MYRQMIKNTDTQVYCQRSYSACDKLCGHFHFKTRSNNSKNRKGALIKRHCMFF